MGSLDVDLGELLGAPAVARVELLRRLERLDRVALALEPVQQELAELIVEVRAVLRVGLVAEPLEPVAVHLLEPVPVRLRVERGDEPLERLEHRRVVLERLLVVVARLLEPVELEVTDGRGRVVVLRELLGVVDELGDPQDDLDQPRPVLALGVDPHELGQQVPVVALDLERRDVALRRLGLSPSFCMRTSPASTSRSKRSSSSAASMRRRSVRTTSSHFF